MVEDYVIDIPFKESLETAMQYNPELLRNAMDAPRHWMEAKQKMGATPISDFFHGQAFWNHPELGKPYKEGDALRLPLMFYGDGITVANPIGVYRNNSKVFLFYWVLLSVVCIPTSPSSLHLCYHNTLLMSSYAGKESEAVVVQHSSSNNLL